MVEYCIYIQKGSCTPYVVGTYNSIYDAKHALNNMLELYKIRRKLYFVDNDFYDNEFSNLCSSDYYCIKVRQVSEWKKYSEFSSHNNNILQFYKNHWQ